MRLGEDESRGGVAEKSSFSLLTHRVLAAEVDLKVAVARPELGLLLRAGLGVAGNGLGQGKGAGLAVALLGSHNVAQQHLHAAAAQLAAGAVHAGRRELGWRVGKKRAVSVGKKRAVAAMEAGGCDGGGSFVWASVTVRQQEAGELQWLTDIGAIEPSIDCGFFFGIRRGLESRGEGGWWRPRPRREQERRTKGERPRRACPSGPRERGKSGETKRQREEEPSRMREKTNKEKALGMVLSPF